MEYALTEKFMKLVDTMTSGTKQFVFI